MTEHSSTRAWRTLDNLDPPGTPGLRPANFLVASPLKYPFPHNCHEEKNYFWVVASSSKRMHD